LFGSLRAAGTVGSRCSAPDPTVRKSRIAAADACVVEQRARIRSWQRKRDSRGEATLIQIKRTGVGE
jgi:hypothetical protein